MIARKINSRQSRYECIREIGPEGDGAAPYAELLAAQDLRGELHGGEGKLMISAAGDAAPMDVDALVRAVNGNLASLVKGKKGGGKSGKAKFEGNCDSCGKKGHKKKDCWSKPQQNGKGGGVKTRSHSLGTGKGKFDGVCNKWEERPHEEGLLGQRWRSYIVLGAYKSEGRKREERGIIFGAARR